MVDLRGSHAIDITYAKQKTGAVMLVTQLNEQ